MSFNLDDPLAGILSDGSDDSFFDDDILGRKKPAKPKVTATPEKKNELFDIEPDKPKPVSNVIIESKKSESVYDINKSGSFKVDVPKSTSFKAVSPTNFKKGFSNTTSVKLDSKTKAFPDSTKSPAKPKITVSADSLDILADFNDSKKAKSNTSTTIEKGKSSQSLLDDILGGPSTKPPPKQINKPTTASKSEEFDFDSFLGKIETNKTTSSNKTIAQKASVKPEKSVKEEKSQKKTKTSQDWLGIFNDDNEIDGVADMPSWLGGETKSEKTTEPEKVLEQPSKQPPMTKDNSTRTQEEPFKQNLVEEQLTEKIKPINATVFPASNEDLTTEGAAMYLQQQESQLMVALQLKAQEEKLAAMQCKIILDYYLQVFFRKYTILQF
jgi:Fas-binding factor 1